MTLILNTSVAVDVSFLAREIVDGSDPENIIYGDQLPGVRLDVQKECLDLYPQLGWGLVIPDNPIHDCGPNGIRLISDSMESIQALAPPTDSPWSIFIQVEE